MQPASAFTCLSVGTALLLVPSFVSIAPATETGFERYEVILSRKPFGDAPPEPVATPPPVAPAESFAKNLRVCSIMVEDDTGDVKVGIVDNSTQKNFLLREGEMEDGIELLSADIELEEAVLQKGMEIARINFASGEITPLSQDDLNRPAGRSFPQATASVAPGQTRSTYQDRRRERLDRRRLRREKEIEKQEREAESKAIIDEAARKYTGEELRNQLAEYNVEMLRQGLPALPIELTPEQDAQLVAENVLPPMENPTYELTPEPTEEYYDDELPLDSIPIEDLLLEEQLLQEVLAFPDDY